MKHHLIIIYDGIENSVFAGQVLAPLNVHLMNYPADRGLIISFEKKMPAKAALDQIAKHTTIDYLILRKIPFLGSLSLRYAAYQLERAMRNYIIHAITARGPLAAWIVTHTKELDHIPCIVQARGLAAQEYGYAHDDTQSWFMKKIHQFRMHQYEAIEQFVYGTYAQQSETIIRAVSEPLRTYLIDTFHTPHRKILVEGTDIPQKIDPTILQTWRSAMRTTMNIPPDTYMYVYNGSAKAWQCPEQTVAYFASLYKNNQNLFLLILTQDQQKFIDLCMHAAIPSCAYHITHVRHDMMYHYLAAADAGIIFRKPHIINWVSRPTKILEYQAVGLTIIHNNTVAMLADYKP